MSNPFTHRFKGKVIGAASGFVLGGPWGSAIGFIIGHVHDMRPRNLDDWKSIWDAERKAGLESEQATFTMGVIVLSAKMAKSDGRVTRAEIDAFKRVFRIAPEHENAVGEIFNRERKSAEGFEPYAYKLAHVFRRNSAVLEQILSGLFIIGAADGSVLSRAEVTFLKRVAFIFGFDAEDFVRIAARSGVKLPAAEKPPKSPTAEAYAILGIKETATAEEAKTAYRALIRKHHPDRLMAEGMPPAFVDSATEKMKRINVAYDMVSKINARRP